MPTVKDVRNRAEEALEHGKAVLNSAQRSAQTKLTEAVVAVTGVAEKTATHDVSLGGRSVSFDSLVADLELIVKRYRESATVRTESLVSDIKNDDRVAKLVERAEGVLSELNAEKRLVALVERAESVYDALYETLQGRLVNPAKDLIGKSPLPMKTPVKKTMPAKRATPAKKTAAAKKSAPIKKAAPAAPAAPAKAAVKAPAKKAPAKKAPAKKAAAKPAKTATRKATATTASS
jgi:hypothetical protein